MSAIAQYPTAPLAALSDLSVISESLRLAESITHKWLKTESEKPTPPAPTELQPAVHSLWRFSVIRKNLCSLTSTPANPNRPTSTLSPAHTPRVTEPELMSEAQILRALDAVPTPKLLDLVSRNLVRHTNAEIKAIKAREADAAAGSQAVPPNASPSLPEIAAQPSRQVAAQTPSDHVPQRTPDHKLKNTSPQSPEPQTAASSNSHFSRAPRGANSSLPPKFRYPPPKRTSV